MAKDKKLTARQEAGLVEKDFEQMPNDEVIAEGEAIDHEAHEATGDVILPRPSERGNPYQSEEEQSMEMTPQVVGPPPYGSPDPTTSAGRLLPLSTHPLDARNLPEDHPARISEDYGADVMDYTHPTTQSSHPLQAASDLELDSQGRRDAREGNYEEMTKDELLSEAQNRGLEVSTSNKKAEIVEALEADDDEAAQS